MFRDPIFYAMCIGFPVLMLLLFNVINRFTPEKMPIFELAPLIPGLMMFSFSFIMLMMCLLVSKDRAGAFIIRLYSSPMTGFDFVGGYVATGLIIGLMQEVVCLLGAYVLAAVSGEAFISVGRALLLLVVMWPCLITNTFLGVWFGTVLTEKSAPGIASILISASGILGGAWMPLDTMGNFEKVCRFLPYLPETSLGRIVTGAYHTLPDPATGAPIPYTFDGDAVRNMLVVGIYLILSVVLAILAFNKKKKI